LELETALQNQEQALKKAQSTQEEMKIQIEADLHRVELDNLDRQRKMSVEARNTIEANLKA